MFAPVGSGSTARLAARFEAAPERRATFRLSADYGKGRVNDLARRMKFHKTDRTGCDLVGRCCSADAQAPACFALRRAGRYKPPGTGSTVERGGMPCPPTRRRSRMPCSCSTTCSTSSATPTCPASPRPRPTSSRRCSGRQGGSARRFWRRSTASATRRAAAAATTAASRPRPASRRPTAAMSRAAGSALRCRRPMAVSGYRSRSRSSSASSWSRRTSPSPCIRP